MAYNKWGVSYNSIKFFEKALSGHSMVQSFERKGDINFSIIFNNSNEIDVLLVDEYCLGLAAIYRALDEFDGIEYIVTCANWNGYTREAKEFGKDNDLGIFNLGEFMGALYSKNPKEYVKKDSDGNPVYAYKVA
ncbi:MAG: hypothetical protein HND52_10280 [Ignavibacteriae bacterium]|nr:hypothetical protein [Ignavibacteriota bacterium]NOG98335.1 hypothetical protein [Ignavibacteriota bacterium]